MVIDEIVDRMTNLGLFESQYDLSQYWFGKRQSYVSSTKCRNRPISTEALLKLISRLESTAQQFSQSEIPSIRDKSQGMRKLAGEVRQEIDKRISI